MQFASKRSAPVPYRLSFGVGTGSLLQPLNSSMIAVALITIGTELAISGGTAWLISSLYLATAVGAPTAGRLADLYGPKRVFLAGLVLVAVGAAIGPLFPTLPGLIVSRVILGLGTSSQYPAAMAIIRARAARHDEESSKALAVLGICAQVSIAFGPTLGGVLVTGLGWQAIFWINLPLCALSALWVWRVAEPDPPREPRTGPLWVRVDLPGIALFASALCALMLYLLSLAGSEPWWAEWWWLVLAVGLGVGWVTWARRAARPFLDLGIFTGRPRLVIVFARQLFVSIAFYAVFYAIPQWLEQARGLDPSSAGLLILPIALVGIVTTIIATAVIRRGGLSITLLIGTLTLIGAGLLIALVLDTAAPLWMLIMVSVLLGVPNGFNNMSNNNELYDLADTDIGAAAGLLRTTQYVGANLAAVLIELLSAGTYDDAGLHRIGYGIAAVAGALLLVTLLGLRLRGPARPTPATRSRH